MIKATINSDHIYEIEPTDSNYYEINGKQVPFEVINATEHEWVVRNGNQQFRILILENDHLTKKYVLKIKGKKYHVQLEDRIDLLLKEMGLSNSNVGEVLQLKAPMPGLILEIIGSKGTPVLKGDKILVLEAMKMENVIKSPTDGVISEILIKIGQSVQKNQLLIQFE